ncbi:HNH endonuclease [Paraburkholderia adhaesiva]|uniref:HNH endonuclease n=1 Tax=Paraburkholderia adhaesiva TaxID=2883244 RepID=UPI001F34A02D|nr:hypothetical protein [Paraburkholderia adhaesiva]
MNDDYARQYKDPRWQRKRLEIMERDGFACVECGDNESTLNVHHVRYLRGVPPWAYPPWLLVTLCESCHEAIHDGGPTIGELLYFEARCVGMTKDHFDKLERAFRQCLCTEAAKLAAEEWDQALDAFTRAIKELTSVDVEEPQARACFTKNVLRLYVK